MLWLNLWIGWSGLTDGTISVLISDYFIPLAMSFWMLGLWFCGAGPERRAYRLSGCYRHLVGQPAGCTAIVLYGNIVVCGKGGWRTLLPRDIIAGGLIGAVTACLITFRMRRIEPAPTWVLKGARLLYLA